MKRPKTKDETWGSDYNGGKPPKPPKRVVMDKAGRLMHEEPSLDLPMKRFRENIDPDKLELFLGEHEKYLPFIAALHDPAFAKLSFASICRRFNVSLHELQSLYTDGMRHMGLLEMSANLPQIMVDVSEDAKSKMELCSRCDGLKVLTEIERDGDGKVVSRTERECPVCEGVGKVKVTGDKHARDLVFESMKLTGQKGPMVAIQQNFGSGNGLDAKMEGMLKLTQGITVGERRVENSAENTEAGV